jgi:hypothetical protein
MRHQLAIAAVVWLWAVPAFGQISAVSVSGGAGVKVTVDGVSQTNDLIPLRSSGAASVSASLGDSSAYASGAADMAMAASPYAVTISSAVYVDRGSFGLGSQSSVLLLSSGEIDFTLAPGATAVESWREEIDGLKDIEHAIDSVTVTAERRDGVLMVDDPALQASATQYQQIFTGSTLIGGTSLQQSIAPMIGVNITSNTLSMGGVAQYYASYTVSLTIMPEPSCLSLALLGAGVLVTAALRRA